MNNNEIDNVNDYYAFYRAPVMIRDDNGTVRSREIGRGFTDSNKPIVHFANLFAKKNAEERM
jgi:hypothetical protein